MNFWRRVSRRRAAGQRVLLVARDAQGICGTVQLILDLPDNQPHRADVAKMLVHRRARRQGLGAALMRAAEAAAQARGRNLLVLDTVTGSDARDSTNGWAGCAWATFPATRCGRAAASWAPRTTTAIFPAELEATALQERRPPAPPHGRHPHAACG